MRSGMRSGHFLSNLVHPFEGSPYDALQILPARNSRSIASASSRLLMWLALASGSLAKRLGA